MAVAFVLSGAVIQLRFRALVPPASVVRAAAAAGAAFFAARLVPHATELGAVGALAAGFAVYLIALVALREITAADRSAIETVLRRRR